MATGVLRTASNYPADVSFAGQGAVAITPSDTVDIFADGSGVRGFHVGQAGDVKVTMINGDVVTFPGCLVGITYPYAITRVWLTGTVPTTIIGVY